MPSFGSHWQWWRLQMSEKFSNGTNPSKQINKQTKQTERPKLVTTNTNITILEYQRWKVLSPCIAQLSWKLKWAFLIACRPSSVCLSACSFVRKLFTFSSSSPELLVQFRRNLAQRILGWWGFKFVQMKGHALSKGRKLKKSKNTLAKFKNLLLLQNQFQPNLTESILGWW